MIKKSAITVIVIITGSLAQAQQNTLKTVPIQNVRVGGEIGRRIELTLENNLEELDVDKAGTASLCKRKSCIQSCLHGHTKGIKGVLQVCWRCSAG